MQDRTPEQVERDLTRERLDPAELPDVTASWLAGSSLDTPALRELAGHPRSDVDGIRRLWAEVRGELDIPPAISLETDRLTRTEFVQNVEELAAALDAHPHGLSPDSTGLLLELWFAVNSGGGPHIEGLSRDEEALIVRAYADYCDATDPLLNEQQQRDAQSDAADHLRALTRRVLSSG